MIKCDLDFLQYHGVIEILLHLLEHPEGKTKTEIQTETALTNSSTWKAHKILFQAGCLKTVTSPNKLLFALSEKGLFMATKLKEIQEKVRNSPNTFEYVWKDEKKEKLGT